MIRNVGNVHISLPGVKPRLVCIFNFKPVYPTVLDVSHIPGTYEPWLFLINTDEEELSLGL